MTAFHFSAGDYVGQVQSQGLRSSSDGKPMFTFMFEVVGRKTSQGVVKDCPRLQRTFRQVLDETLLDRLRANLKALDLEPLHDFRQLMPGFPGAINLQGKEIDVTCSVGEFNGKPAENWDVCRNKLLPEAAVNELQAHLGHLLAPQKESAPAQAQVPAAGAA